ncbi:hypothetical protein ACLOJK_013788 [Asimina triloba]
MIVSLMMMGRPTINLKSETMALWGMKYEPPKTNLLVFLGLAWKSWASAVALAEKKKVFDLILSLQRLIRFSPPIDREIPNVHEGQLKFNYKFGRWDAASMHPSACHPSIK